MWDELSCTTLIDHIWSRKTWINYYIPKHILMRSIKLIIPDMTFKILFLSSIWTVIRIRNIGALLPKHIWIMVHWLDKTPHMGFQWQSLSEINNKMKGHKQNHFFFLKDNTMYMSLLCREILYILKKGKFFFIHYMV